MLHKFCELMIKYKRKLKKLWQEEVTHQVLMKCCSQTPGHSCIVLIFIIYPSIFFYSKLLSSVCSIIILSLHDLMVEYNWPTKVMNSCVEVSPCTNSSDTTKQHSSSFDLDFVKLHAKLKRIQSYRSESHTIVSVHCTAHKGHKRKKRERKWKRKNTWILKIVLFRDINFSEQYLKKIYFCYCFNKPL